jgi:hypothetical protein
VAADLVCKAGDLQPRWDVTFRDANGDPVDISATDVAVSVSLVYDSALNRRYRRGEMMILDRVPASNDQTDADSFGKAHYQPVAGDTDTPGGYEVEFVAEFADGSETFPNAAYLKLAIYEGLVAEAS